MMNMTTTTKQRKMRMVLQVTLILEGVRTSKEAVALKEKSAKGLERVVELSIERFFVSID